MALQAQFGTLTDYFNAVHAEKDNSQFPSLSGDFSLMQIGMITTGVVTILHDLSIKEWIEYFCPT